MARKKREPPNFEGYLQGHKKWHYSRWRKWKGGGWKNAKGNLRGAGRIISYIKNNYPGVWSDWQKFRTEMKSKRPPGSTTGKPPNTQPAKIGRKPLPQPRGRKKPATKKLPLTLEERRKRRRRRKYKRSKK